MVTALYFPYPFKLVHIVLTEEGFVLQGIMSVFIQLLHHPLPHCHIVEMQYLAPVAYAAEISGGVSDLTIYFLQNYCKFFEGKLG